MDPRADMMFKITKQMKNAIDEVYSKHDMTGNDLQVIVACDYVFEQYCQTYVPGYQSSQCVLLLYRARRVNGLIRQSAQMHGPREWERGSALIFSKLRCNFFQLSCVK